MKSNLASKVTSPIQHKLTLESDTYYLIKLLKEIVFLLEELKLENFQSEDLCNSILAYIEKIRLGQDTQLAYYQLKNDARKVIELIFQPKMLNLRSLGLYKTTIK
jgi:hypothetical protein